MKEKIKMKKLMIAAAVVCAAAISQAASFSWNTSAQAYGIAGADMAALVNGKHYDPGTANADRMKAQSATTSYAVAWAFEMTLSNSDGVSDKVTGDVSNYSSNKIKLEGLESKAIYNAATDEGIVNVSYSIVITGTYTDAKGTEWTLTSDAIKGSTPYGKLSNLELTTAAPAGWTATTAAVPEPTSGLLLLLGMAGLALRRRRA